MNKKKSASVRPDAGNTEELDRLEAEIGRLEYHKDRMTKENAALLAETTHLKKELSQALAGLEAARDEIAELKKATTASPDAQDGYCQIVALTPKGVRPQEKRINGVPCKRVIDMDGQCLDTVPVKNAISFLAEEHGQRHVLVGPMDEIKASVPDGMYSKEVVFSRHSKRKHNNGKVEWIRVEFEESAG